MPKTKSQFTCQECGAIHSNRAGHCDQCGAWNTILEEKANERGPKGLNTGKGNRIDLVGLKGPKEQTFSNKTGIAEFDRVCGGGLVPGSALLVGGDPGIGKSTLLLQVTAAFAK